MLLSVPIWRSLFLFAICMIFTGSICSRQIQVGPGTQIHKKNHQQSFEMFEKYCFVLPGWVQTETKLPFKWAY